MPYYWFGGSGTWDATDKTHWSNISGGAGGFGPPSVGAGAVFDANSGTGVCNVASNLSVNDLVFDCSTLNLQLSGNLTLNGRFTLTSGTINLNNNILYASDLVSSNSNVRQIQFGIGKISLSGGNRTVCNFSTATNFTYTGTPSIELTYSGSTGTRLFRMGTGGSEINALNVKITAGSDTIDFNQHVKNIDFSGFSGSFINNVITCYGNFTLSSDMSVISSIYTLKFASTNAATQFIATNGKTLDFPVTFDGVGGSWSLTDDLSIGSTRAVLLANGTFNANGKNVSLGTFALSSGTKTLTLGSGTWTVSGSGAAWNANTNVANLTVSASTGTISMTSSSAKTFAGGSKIWPTLNQGGSGALTIQQSNTFANITNTVQPATITLTSGTTQTVTSFGVSGTAGNLITLNSSSAGSQATLSDSSGVNSVSFVSIKDINATGGATWSAFITNGNVDAGNNTGWDFLVQLGQYMYNVRKSKRILQQGVI